MPSKKIVVIGAGITGLATAWKLCEHGADVAVLERKGTTGGVSASFKRGAYTLDLGPHKVYTQIPGIIDEYRGLLGDDFIAIPKSQHIMVKGKYYAFPVKIQQLLFGMNPVLAAQCGVSYAAAIGRKAVSPLPDTNYENYLINRFGNTVYSLLFEPYAWKVWGDPKTLSAELAKARISVPSLAELAKRTLIGDGGEKELSAKTFFYPRKGFGEVCDRMVDRINEHGGEIVTGAMPTKIITANNAISEVEYTAEGKAKRIPASFLVSTMPINELPKLFEPAAPAAVLEAAAKIKWRSVILVFIVVDRDRLFEDNWRFFPEAEFYFNRVSEQKGFNAELIPKGKTVLCAEITCDFLDEKWRATDKELYARVIADLEKAKITKDSEVSRVNGEPECFTVKLKDPYPVYSIGFEQNVKTILDYLDSIKGVMTLGRLGLFNYNNTDHCIDMARKAADYIVSGQPISAWQAQREEFKKYIIVD